MNKLAKKFATGFGVVAYAMNFGGFVDLQENSARYLILLSGDLYQLHQHEEGSKIFSSHGISLDDTTDSVGVMVPLKEKHFVKVVNRERIVEFYVSPDTGYKMISICENDKNDIESKAEIRLYGLAAQEMLRHIPDRIKEKLDPFNLDIGFASLSNNDSPRLWYAFLPGRSKTSDLYRTEILSSSKSWELKKIMETLEPVSANLRHMDLTEDEHTDLILKFIEGKKREYNGEESNFFISEGRGVKVHDSISSIVAFNKEFIEGVYSFLPSELRENLPDVGETESIFLYPSQGGLKLNIEAKDSYSIHLKNKDKVKLMNFLSKHGYTNPMKLKS